MGDQEVTDHAAPVGVASVRRVLAIDGLRGLCLILMLDSHLILSGGSVLKSLHPDRISFLDAAYGFVFLSGLAVGLAYTRLALTRGFAAAVTRLLQRALRLYVAALGLLVGLAGAALVIPGFADACRELLGAVARWDWRLMVAAAAMVQEAEFADILQPYVFYLGLTPLALAACLSGRSMWVLYCSMVLWIAAQFNLTEPLTLTLGAGLRRLRPDLQLPNDFNLAAWQLVYFGGVVLGAQHMRGEIDLKRWFPAHSKWWVWLAFIMLASCGVFVIFVHHVPSSFPAYVVNRFPLLTSKPGLGTICLINFVSAAYSLSWLLIRGPSSGSRVFKVLSGAVHRLLASRFLTLLGAQSLIVYVWHVWIVYTVRWFDWQLGPLNQAVSNAIAVTAIALLPLPVLARNAATRMRRPPLVRPAEPMRADRPVQGG